MSTSWIGRSWHKLQQRRLSLMLYLAAGLAFVATLSLAVTAFHFSTATLTAARQINDTAVRQSIAATEFTLLIEAHRRVVFRARNAKDIDYLIVSMGILAPIEQRLFSFAERGELVTGGRLRTVVHEAIGTGRVLLTARALGVDDADTVVRYLRQFSLATAHARRIRAQAQDLSAAHIVSLQRSADDLRRWTAFFGILALLCTGPFSFFLLHRSILRLRQVTRALRHLASGNLSAVSLSALTESASHETADEISMMVDAIKVYHFTAQSLEESRHEVQRVNSRLHVALENMFRGLSMFGPDERLIVCNGSYKRMYDLPDHLTVPGASLQSLLEWRARASPGDRDVPKIITRYRAAVASRQPLRYTRALADGRIIEISLQPLEDGGWVTVHEDVTKEREAEAKISRLAKEDALTGLVNRRGFTEALDAISRRDPISAPDNYAILCIDLDLFKSVNDTLGHPAGDEVLRIVARRLRAATRERDIIARIGGDEFAIIIDRIHALDDIDRLAARLVRMLSEPMAVANTHAAIGASIGIALSSRQPLTSANLLAQADMALYWAKSHGRNTWRIYDADIEAPIKLRRQLENDMRPGLLGGQFALHFQPIFGLEQRDVIACEALVRWRHPERGFVSPADFIPLAEKNGFIKELGAWVLDTACRVASDWPQHVRVAVNISAVQLQSANFYDLVVETLEKTQYAPDRLELEVTETALLDDSASTIATLHKLKALGIIISLDDFGTGYSSLSYLRRFPFDQLKIDQSFVRDSSDRDDCVAIVRAIAGLAASLDMTTVAEGVETHDHLVKVRLAGCSAVQGYLFSKPVPAQEVGALFRSWKTLIAA